MIPAGATAKACAGRGASAALPGRAWGPARSPVGAGVPASARPPASDPPPRAAAPTRPKQARSRCPRQGKRRRQQEHVLRPLRRPGEQEHEADAQPQRVDAPLPPQPPEAHDRERGDHEVERHEERARVVPPARHGPHQPHERLPGRPAGLLDRLAAAYPRGSPSSRRAGRPGPATGTDRRGRTRRSQRRGTRRWAAAARGAAREPPEPDPRTRSTQSTTIARPATPYRYLPAQARPSATAAATSHAPRRRDVTPERHARVESRTESRAKNAGTASSITWLVYLMLQVWTARNSPPIGDTSASSPAVSAPTTASNVRASVRWGSGRLFAGPAVVGRSWISGAGGRGASTNPMAIFVSGGCSGR